MKKRILTILITICSLILLSGMTVLAEEDAPSTQEDTSANSWRYENGNPIESEETDDGVTIYSGNDMTWGIDVSSHQGVINWTKVKAAGVDFAIIRCGYGNNYTAQDDRRWAYNVSECERLGIPYGVYLYSYAKDTNMAKSEAEHALRLLNGHTPAYPVYYDMEDESTYGSDYAELATTFCTMIENAGYRAGVYANLNWWNNHLTDPVFETWDRWVAQFNTTCDYKGAYSIWQYTSTGRVDGIAGDVDMNYVVNSKGESTGGNQTSNNNQIPNDTVILPFSDVTAEDWFEDAVRFMYQRNLMTGLSDEYYGSYETLSRGHFVTVLYRNENEPETSFSSLFPDVSEGMFYSSPVTWAANAGIVSGYENGTFGVADSITREQMVVMMYRYAQYRGLDVSTKGDLNSFPDASSVSNFATEAMRWAVGVSMIQGNQGQLNPTHSITRAECATIMMRFIETYAL